jgi:integrase
VASPGTGVLERCYPALEGEPLATDADAKDQAAAEAGPRQDFMTRSEAARFLWKARQDATPIRFFLIGWYTGSRRSVITGLKWSMVNLETGIMQRKERGAVQTKKRSPARQNRQPRLLRTPASDGN